MEIKQREVNIMSRFLSDRVMKELILANRSMLKAAQRETGDANPEHPIYVRNGWTFAHVAARDGDVESLRNILAHVCDVNMEDRDGWTPLDLARFNGMSETAELLEEKGGIARKVRKVVK